MTLIIRDAQIIDPTSPYHLQIKDILIVDGVIQAIDTNIASTADQEIREQGLSVSTGWTDLFADYREPGYEHKETILSGLNAAAAGGFTHVLTTPNTQPIVNSKATIQYILSQAAGHLTQVHPLGVISAHLEGKAIAEMMDMHANGAIAFTDAWKPIQNATLMLKALEYVKSFEGTLIQIPIETTLAQGGLMHEGEESTRLGMPGIPSIAEHIMVHRDIELVRYTQSKLHFTGISCAESVHLIRKAKADGLSISCSVTPYHLALNDSALGNYSAMYKVLPPLRGEQDRQALITGVLDGTIDGITSHHRPQEWDAKAKEFEYATDGMNIQELAFAVTWDTLHHQASITQVIAALSHQVNQIFGIQQESISAGKKANLTLFSTAATTNIAKMHSKSANNPFLNKTLQGRVIGTINGNKTYLNTPN